jgi:hypothetical protein
MKIWDPNKGADTCVRANLYFTAIKIQAEKDNKYMWTRLHDKAYKDVKKYCGLDGWFSHRKSHLYRWADDVHPGKWSPRHFIYKLTGFNPACGLNGDQYRAYFNMLAITKDWLGALKVLVSIILHGGFFPSMTGYTLLKPHTFFMLFRAHWLFYPVSWVLYPLWLFSVYRNLGVPTSKDTSNKITMLPTLYLAKTMGFPLPKKLPSQAYIYEVYNIYFKAGSDCAFIGNNLKRALTL